MADHTRSYMESPDDPNVMGFVSMRQGWAVRNDDLDVIGTFLRYAAPLGTAAGVLTIAGATTVAMGAASGGVAAVAASLYLIRRACLRKRAKVNPVQAIALYALKERPAGATATDVAAHLTLATGQTWTETEVSDELTTLTDMKADDGSKVVLVFQDSLSGLWKSAA